MRISVTGSSGFLGSHLTKALGQLPGAEVVILPRTSSGDFPGRDKLRSFVRDLDLIYHVADVNRGTDDEILIGNIETTFNLVKAAKKTGKPSQRIVFASSSQVYKPVTQSGKVITEFHKAEPTTLFGVTKQPQNILSGFQDSTTLSCASPISMVRVAGPNTIQSSLHSVIWWPTGKQ